MNLLEISGIIAGILTLFYAVYVRGDDIKEKRLTAGEIDPKIAINLFGNQPQEMVVFCPSRNRELNVLDIKFVFTNKEKYNLTGLTIQLRIPKPLAPHEYMIRDKTAYGLSESETYDINEHISAFDFNIESFKKLSNCSVSIPIRLTSTIVDVPLFEGKSKKPDEPIEVIRAEFAYYIECVIYYKKNPITIFKFLVKIRTNNNETVYDYLNEIDKNKIKTVSEVMIVQI